MRRAETAGKAAGSGLRSLSKGLFMVLGSPLSAQERPWSRQARLACRPQAPRLHRDSREQRRADRFEHVVVTAHDPVHHLRKQVHFRERRRRLYPGGQNARTGRWGGPVAREGGSAEKRAFCRAKPLPAYAQFQRARRDVHRRALTRRILIHEGMRAVDIASRRNRTRRTRTCPNSSRRTILSQRISPCSIETASRVSPRTSSGLMGGGRK
jgi:hypothetical protein